MKELCIYSKKIFYFVGLDKFSTYICDRFIKNLGEPVRMFNPLIPITMRRLLFDHFSAQALSGLHRYRAVMFSPTL